MDWILEVVIVPVSDVDRAAAFYRDRAASSSTTTPAPSTCTPRSWPRPDAHARTCPSQA